MDTLAAPVGGLLPPRVVPPQLDSTSNEYQYRTVSGTYAFSKALPFVLRYEAIGGEVLVDASTFVVFAPGVSLFRDVMIIEAEPYRYQVRYDVYRGGRNLGNVTITYDFRDDGPPKLTAIIAWTDSRTFQGGWVAFTRDTVAFNGTTAFDFRTVSPPVRVGTPKRQLRVGPDGRPDAWTRSLKLDWSDAAAGEAFAGRISLPFLEGSAILVKFPEGMGFIDPVTVGTTADSLATRYSIQRKAFEQYGRFWTFWFDGSEAAYASSVNGVDWTSPLYVGTAAVAHGFDVAQRDDTVLVAYIPSTGEGPLKRLMLMQGTLSGGTSLIRWSGPYVIATWTVAEAGPASVAIGSDGRIWVAGLWRDGGTTKAWVYVTNENGVIAPSPFGEDVVTGAPADSVVRIVPLSNGTVVKVIATKGSTTITTKRFSQGGWGAPHPWNIRLSMDPAYAVGDMLSVVEGADDRVHFVFRGDVISPGIRHSALLKDDTMDPLPPASEIVDPLANQVYPVVARDANGDLHAFWVRVDPPSCYCIRYSAQGTGGGAWTGAQEFWGVEDDPRQALSAAPLASRFAFVTWTEDEPGNLAVQFGAVATPVDMGSQTGQPWNRQGLSPFQTYFQSLSEAVSPGSGLLTVRQTDLVLPGRHFDFEVARVFTTPRAFSPVNAVNTPYLYEDYPAANLGKGWALDLPWLTDRYLHLWNGQAYVIRWEADRFENHDGDHFLLERSPGSYPAWTLYAKNGVQYFFNADRQLKEIRHPAGEVLTFEYDQGRLDFITDALGRTVDFTHEGGLLTTIRSGPMTVTLEYDTGRGVPLLRFVRSPGMRTTRFEHWDIRTPYLMSAVVYATGGSTVYEWGSANFLAGNDLTAYYVASQDTRNTAGLSVRANLFSYTVVNGRVSYAEVEVREAGVTTKGRHAFWFDAGGGKSTVVVYDAAGNRMSKTISWFSAAGEVEQVDAYPGSMDGIRDSSRIAYDEWGNPIYSRDAAGRERFTSFVNTRSQNVFVAPGNLPVLARTGAPFYDDFEDRNVDDWTLVGSSLEYFGPYETVPPVLRLLGTETLSASASHPVVGDLVHVWVEAVVQPAEISENHDIRLFTGADARVWLRFADDGRIRRQVAGGSFADVMAYSADHWYRATVHVDRSRMEYTLWVNGEQKATAPLIGNDGAIDRISLESAACNPGPCTSTMYVDSAKVWASMDLTVSGLAPWQIVQFRDRWSRTVGTWRASGGGTATLNFPGGSDVFPHGTFLALDSSGEVEFTSPAHEFWGGDLWTYSPPWRSVTHPTYRGIGSLTSWYVDEDFPPYVKFCSPCKESYREDWDWGTYAYPFSGAFDHRSKYVTGYHFHGFKDDPDPVMTMSAGEYHVQYARLDWNLNPSEVLLAFRDTTNSWEHRAYWGTEIICQTYPPCPTPPAPMGDLPWPPGRWAMLLAKAEDVGTVGRTIEGLGYHLWGGNATWDLSARGIADIGGLRINGLSTGWKVEVYDARGQRISWATAAGTSAWVNLYEGTERDIRAFPFDGFYVIRDGAGAGVYRSPVFPLWGGDVFAFDGTDFYANADVDLNIHDLVVGRLEFQTGRLASPQIRQDGYVRYTVEGLLDNFRERDAAAWRVTRVSYDPVYKVGTAVTEALGTPLERTTTYAHSAAYGHAYATGVTNPEGETSRSAFDPVTGWVLGTRDPRGHRTRFEYDAFGRPTREAHRDAPSSSDILSYDMEWTTEEAVPRLEDLSSFGSHGTLSDPDSVSGKVGLSRDFDGSSDYIGVEDATSLDATSALTVSFWANHDYASNPGATKGLVSKGPDTATLNYEVSLTATRQIQMTWSGGIPAVVSSTSLADPERWYHVVAVFDWTSNVFRLYIDGVLDASQTILLDTTPNSGRLVLGKLSEAAPASSFFDGRLDEVRLFNRALSEAEVDALFRNTFGLVTWSDLVYDDVGNVVTQYDPTTMARRVHLDMESVLGGDLEDLAGAGHHAIIEGTTTVTGRVGDAQAFDGSDFLEIPDGPALDLTSSATVAFWIRHDYASDPTSEKGLFFKGTTEAQGNYAGWLDTSRHLVMGWGDGGSSDALASAAALTESGRWYHVALVFDWARNTFRIYLDGQPDPAETSPVNGAANAGRLWLGKMSQSSPPDKYFAGRIDEFQVFDRALGDADVQAIYEGTEPGAYRKAYYDSIGRTTRVLRQDLFGGLLSADSYAHDFGDSVVTHTSPRATTTRVYDFMGRLEQVTPPGSAPLQVTYDDVNRVTTAVAENGRKVQYVRDVTGALREAREYYDPLGYYSTSYEYDHAGNLLVVENAFGQVMAHSYDGMNRLTKTTYADGKYEEYAYDVLGRLLTRRDRAVQVTNYGYNDADRPTLIDYPGTADDVAFAYEPDGSPDAVTNSFATVAYDYDPMGRMTDETTTVGGVPYHVGYSYGTTNRITRLEYPDESFVDYTYDAVGRVRDVKLGEDILATFAYEADDLVKDLAFGNGIIQSFTYNARGWPTLIRAAKESSEYLNLPYDEDDSGNVLAAGTDSFTYDALDRVKTASGDFGAYEYAYDAVGNRIRLDQDPDAGDVVLRPNGPGSAQTWHRVNCDVNWQCVDEAFPDDTTYVFADPEDVNFQDKYAFQNLDQPGVINSVTVTAIAKGEPTGACPGCPGALRLLLNGEESGNEYLDQDWEVVRRTWTTNPATNDRWQDSEIDNLQAGFLRPLVQEVGKTLVTQVYVTVNLGGSTTYWYDDSPSGFNTLDSLIRNGVTTSFQYDHNGNQIWRQEEGGPVWTYAWNAENLMTSATRDGVLQERYVYDGLGRRVKVEGATPATWTVSVVSGLDVIFEKDHAGGVTKYVWANGMRIARITSGEVVAYYLGDHLGSTRKVMDSYLPDPGADELFSAKYEPFGKPYGLIGSEVYRYTGEKHDDPTSLVYLRARQYDPDLGRFVSADPILGVPSLPQTLNRYPYVANNPTKYTDPTGEIAPVVAALAAIVVIALTVAVLSHVFHGIRAYTDAFADLFGLVPIFGDVYDLAYYGLQGGLDCVSGRCDLTAIVVNMGGSVPVAGDLLKGAKYAGMGIGFVGLVTRGVRRADPNDVKRAIDALGGIPYTSRHIRRAQGVGGIDALTHKAKGLLTSAVDSPGSFRFFLKQRGGLTTYAVVGEGHTVLVHMGKSGNWIGSLLQGSVFRGLRQAEYEDFAAALLRG